FFFFLQAEDGIRDFHVTGVQTCALPISTGGDARLRAMPSLPGGSVARSTSRPGPLSAGGRTQRGLRRGVRAHAATSASTWRASRSEERRVGKEGRSERAPRGECRHGRE